MLNHINVVNITVVPAQPGNRPIFADSNGGFCLGDCDVIAWRIETFTTHNNEDLCSSVTPLEPGGECHCVAVLTPNGGVDELCNTTYESYDAFLEAKQRERS